MTTRTIVLRGTVSTLLAVVVFLCAPSAFPSSDNQIAGANGVNLEQDLSGVVKSRSYGIIRRLAESHANDFIEASLDDQAMWDAASAIFEEQAPSYQSEVSQGSAVTNAYTVSEYFPLDPGILWIYMNNSNPSSISKAKIQPHKVRIGGVDTTPMRNTKTGITYYYTSDANGLQLHGTFEPNLYIPDAQAHSDLLTYYSPPAKWAHSDADIGDQIISSGKMKVIAVQLGATLNMSYSSDYTLEALETIDVPAGPFEVLRFFGSFIIDGDQMNDETMYLARNKGIVKEVAQLGGLARSTAELTFTNAGAHDLAITKIVPPATIELKSAAPSKTMPVKVKIQNRAIYPEVIADATVLSRLITLTVESLGNCLGPVPSLHVGKPQRTYPITLKPKDVLTIYYDVVFDCANDPLKDTRGNPGHSDYRFSAVVNRSILDGIEDIHPVDDVCPRTIKPPHVIDPYPDQRLKDRGCGKLKTDGTFGGEVLTDIIVK